MIYRIITDFRMVRGRYDPEQKEFVSQWIVPEEREYQRMTGAGRCFGDVMFCSRLAGAADSETKGALLLHRTRVG